MDKPFASILIPCRDEEKYLAGCLDSILAQDYPPECFEILLADGMSSDRTQEILMDYANRYSKIKWFENPGKIIATGVNILIPISRGTVIIRMDVHADYPKDYISKCVCCLFEQNVDVVGGFWNTLPASSLPVARSIALALSNWFGVGNAHFRIRSLKEPKLVDSVPFGCYRREVFDKIGFYDEDMGTNEDVELHLRLSKSGGKILLIPEIVSNYYARESFDKLWQIYYRYGYFKPLVALKIGGIRTWRQLLPPLFVSSLLIFAVLGLFHSTFQGVFLLVSGTYLLVNLVVSTVLSMRQGIELFPYLILSFMIVHFGYGIGYLRGILNFGLLKRNYKNKAKGAAFRIKDE